MKEVPYRGWRRRCDGKSGRRRRRRKLINKGKKNPVEGVVAGVAVLWCYNRGDGGLNSLSSLEL